MRISDWSSDVCSSDLGGYAQKARLSGDWLVKLPENISTKDAMAIGTAGYTAMLSVLALEHGGITPERGDILVTGANGGVGSIAIALLSDLGYRVVASTGRLDQAERSEEHTSELQSLMRNSYAVFCLKKKTKH